ncbi:E3 ubiquitin-protein ligase RNF186-like [Rhineura floridana]|uniref:E3 ubiquitin-protein ligase RNF186-like n=1 Tax=Rhineura floridana TaxID=261503 RepID=UPI002AC85E2F|nr:E3 ubiquitin-protein ligase RNF186-like [Rhineura floridana]
MEDIDRGESVEETGTEMDKAEFPKEQMENMGNKGRPVQMSGLEGSTSSVAQQFTGVPNHSALDMKPPTSFPPPFPLHGSAENADFGCSSGVPDTDCLICFNRYSLNRLPKLLACQHVFCAVCLKLILRNEGNTWKIICPLCREATAVIGGLVCSLRNKEDALLEPLTNPRPKDPFSPGSQSGKPVPCGTSCSNQDDDSDSKSNNPRVAAKRLVFLLLLLVLLTIFLLVILDTGILKWALCIAIGWGLAMAGILCFNPKWGCSFSPSSLLPWRKRTSHITSVA